MSCTAANEAPRPEDKERAVGRGVGGNGARKAGAGGQVRGRPRRNIDMGAVADAVGELFTDGGYEAVSISNAAAKLGVSRATLYRTVPTKQKLLGIAFERASKDLMRAAQEVLNGAASPRDQLHELIRIQVSAAVRMRRYLSVFFGGAGLSPDVFTWWHTWSREYEKLWTRAVNRAMHAGVLRKGDPVLETRLLLGMVIWVGRWYRASDGDTPEAIAAAAIDLLQSSDYGGVDGAG